MEMRRVEMTRKNAPLGILPFAMTLLCAVIASVAAAQTTPRYSPSAFGINGSQRGIENAYQKVFETDGIAWARLFVGWPAVQPTSDPPDWDRKALGPKCHGWPRESAREMIDNAYDAGMSIIVTVVGTPCWAVAGGKQGNCSTKPAREPLFEEFMAAAATEFGDKVAVWEIGNEPNWNTHWSGSPGLYRDKMLAPGYDGVKSVRPDALVAGPTLYRKGIKKADKTDRFAPYVLTAAGVPVRPIDVLTFHSYQQEVSGFRKDIKQAHKFAEQHGIPEVWMTEFGWSKKGGRGSVRDCARCGSEHNCTAKLTKAYAKALSADFPRFTRSFAFSLHDRNQAFCVKGCRFGFFDASGTPRSRIEP